MDSTKIIEKLAAEGHLNAEQVERIGHNVSEIMDAVDKNPSILKEAGIGGDMGNMFLKQVLPATLVSAGTVLGIRGIESLYDTIKKHTMGAHQKREAFSSMMEAHPDLSERDPAKVQRHFDSLYHFSPTYAADPLMAGEYIKSTMDSAAVNLTSPKTVADVEKALRGSGRKPMEDFVRFEKATPEGPDMRSLESEARLRATGAEELGRLQQMQQAKKPKEEIDLQNLRARAYGDVIKKMP